MLGSKVNYVLIPLKLDGIFSNFMRIFLAKPNHLLSYILCVCALNCVQKLFLHFDCAANFAACKIELVSSVFRSLTKCAKIKHVDHTFSSLSNSIGGAHIISICWLESNCGTLTRAYYNIGYFVWKFDGDPPLVDDKQCNQWINGWTCGRLNE